MNESEKSGSRSGRKWIIAAIVIIALVIAGVWYKNYTAPRTLIINGDASINVDAGGSADLSAAADGLDGDIAGDIEWTVSNPDLLSIEDSKVTGHYDRASFSKSGEEDVCPAKINGKLKKGLRNWEGDSTVYVHIVPESFTNGQVYREPAGSKDSYVKVTAAPDHNTYFYFKSMTDPNNDCAFIVEAGNKATIDMPCDTYEIYEAHGQTWYGTDIKFGPKTSYTKYGATVQFVSDSFWEISVGEQDGKAVGNKINAEDFPDAG